MESIDLFDTRKKGKLARSQTGTVGTAAVEPASFDLVGRMTDPALGLQNPRPSVERSKSKTMLLVYSDLFLAVHRLLQYKFTCRRPLGFPRYYCSSYHIDSSVSPACCVLAPPDRPKLHILLVSTCSSY
jgi:hypothetical protein